MIQVMRNVSNTYQDIFDSDITVCFIAVSMKLLNIFSFCHDVNVLLRIFNILTQLDIL